MNKLPAVVSVKWLAGKILQPPKNFRVVDASWHLPSTGRDARVEYLSKHIPGAPYFDIDECADKTSDLSHMLPRPADFESYVGNLGISNDTHVVVYDNNETFGIMSAQRVWWMFRIFGHDQVSVLDGGLPMWVKEGHPVTTEVPTFSPVKFVADFRQSLVKSYDDMEKNIQEKNYQVVDARPTGRFEGKDPEPRPNIKSGHIPGSNNIPFFSIMDPETKTIKSPEELQKMFKEAGVDLDKPLTATCGSGVSACCLALAAYMCGKPDVAIYDGSWLEWFLRAPPELKAKVPKD